MNRCSKFGIKFLLDTEESGSILYANVDLNIDYERKGPINKLESPPVRRNKRTNFEN